MPTRKIAHLVSDSTGETVLSAVKAASSQFPGLVLETRMHAFVRTVPALEATLETVRATPGALFYTIADAGLGQTLRHRAETLGLAAVDVLGPTLAAMGQLAGGSPAGRPGGQYRVDTEYFDRVAAIEYAISHDDGLSAARLGAADVILVGVSRTSKTPTCIYLAYQGIRAANVPLLRGEGLPDPVLDAHRKGIPVIGLTASPQRLVQIRAQRLAGLDLADAGAYGDLDHIRDEVTEARLLFEKHRFPVIDVTRRSIEETAAAIRQILGAEAGA